MGEDVGGIAVHIAARISSEAGASEVPTSSTVKDPFAGQPYQDGASLMGIIEKLRVLAVAEVSTALAVACPPKTQPKMK